MLCIKPRWKVLGQLTFIDDFPLDIMKNFILDDWVHDSSPDSIVSSRFNTSTSIKKTNYQTCKKERRSVKILYKLNIRTCSLTYGLKTPLLFHGLWRLVHKRVTKIGKQNLDHGYFLHLKIQCQKISQLYH